MRNISLMVAIPLLLGSLSVGGPVSASRLVSFDVTPASNSGYTSATGQLYIPDGFHLPPSEDRPYDVGERGTLELFATNSDRTDRFFVLFGALNHITPTQTKIGGALGGPHWNGRSYDEIVAGGGLDYLLDVSNFTSVVVALYGQEDRQPAVDGRFFIGNVTNFRELATVPEPGTWGLLILGFGAAGGAMRRQRGVAKRRMCFGSSRQ